MFFQGTQHQVGVVACKCEPFSVTLSRLRLWPTSSKQPTYALTFELLDWMEAMLLECQVSLSDFCKALNHKLPAYVVVSEIVAYCVCRDHDQLNQDAMVNQSSLTSESSLQTVCRVHASH